MNERYTQIQTLPEDLYMDHAPVLIASGALLKDNQTGKVLAQLKMKNLKQSKLVSYKISAKAFDRDGMELSVTERYSYLDLAASRKETFDHPIALPDSTTENISVSVIQAVFEDGTVWQSPAGKWESIAHHRQKIADKFPDVEMQRQYALAVGEDCEYVPMSVGNLFFCTCGAVNLSENHVCGQCGRNFSDLLSAVDLSDPIPQKEERFVQEEWKPRAQKIQGRAKPKTHNRGASGAIKMTFTVGCIIAFAAAVSVFFTQVIIPSNPSNK